MDLSNKRILLGVTGGIAAYKVADLVRRFVKAGADVRVVMTEGAQAFVTPLTFQALSGKPVHLDLLDSDAEAAMGHIELARWPDLIIIAPATADFIARFTSGMADDLLATLCVASAQPIAIVPAMNQQMWASEATQSNMRTLNGRDCMIWGPASGAQACGDVGLGRMLEPVEIANKVDGFFNDKPLLGQSWVITAGPTVEKIDPVRFLSNRSSGKMGFAIAAAAVSAGATVTLIAGPVALDTPNGVLRVDVESAVEMLSAVDSATEKADVFIACAAVSDYRSEAVAANKMKKQGDEGLTIKLVQNPDILKWVADNRTSYAVGFAAETQNLAAFAQAKMQRKGVPMICANDVSRTDIGFGSDDNAVTVFYQMNDAVRGSGDNETKVPLNQVSLGPSPKKKVAEQLVALIAQVRY